MGKAESQLHIIRRFPAKKHLKMQTESVVEACFTPHAVSDNAMQSVKIEINDNLFFMSNFSFKIIVKCLIAICCHFFDMIFP